MTKKIVIGKNQKRLYLLLIGLAFILILFGIFNIFIISNDNKSFIKENIIGYFNNYESSIEIFFKTLFNNFVYLIVIWILGISIIGIPVILFMFLFKSFVFGFSVSSIFYSYGFKGIFTCLADILLNKFIYLIILLLVVFYSLSFSFKLIKHLFFKKPINFKEVMSKYLKILIIALSICLFITIYEVFLEHLLIKIL